MAKGRVPLKNRVEQDENFILKVIGEVGDMARYLRYLEAQIQKLKRRVKKLEKI